MTILVLCCGSRNYNNFHMIKKTLRRFMLAVESFKVLHGGAYTGADPLSGEAAMALGLEVEVMKAQWLSYGKRAGMLRNTAMLERKPDYVIAFWDGASRGTLDTIQKAVNVYRIPTMIVRS